MGVNKAEIQMQDSVVNTLAQTRRDLDAIKTAQPIGADVLKAVPTPTTGYLLAGPFTLSAGSASTINAAFIPASQVLTLWNCAATLYVDANTDTNQWPSNTAGTSTLTSGQRNMVFMSWLDFSDSSDVTNSRVFKFRIRNDDSASHTFYVRIRGYLPITGSVTS